MPKTTEEKASSITQSNPVRIALWVRAGGRCEFLGCNKYLLDDEFTGLNELFLGDVAHVVGRSRKGPRGSCSLPVTDRNKVGNLMLLCSEHHNKIIDKSPKDFPVELLLEYKKVHEDRILYQTSLGPESETAVIRLIGNIRGGTVSVSDGEIREAVLACNRYPRYLMAGKQNGIEIDLSKIAGKDSYYWDEGKKIIDKVVDLKIFPSIEDGSVKHISVFALARIPLIAYFGNKIGDKIKIDIYQKHRDSSESWKWPSIKGSIDFKSTVEQIGAKDKIALCISASGVIARNALPANIGKSFTIYRLNPIGEDSSRSIIGSNKSAEIFRVRYAQLLREIEKLHPSTKELHVFAAVPVSLAFHIGRELLKGVTPSLIIYDRNDKGNYEETIIVNPS
ncbi:MAG: HNH endonuclease [Patescibacteria group bacterium]|jgi:hypothetical protein